MTVDWFDLTRLRKNFERLWKEKERIDSDNFKINFSPSWMPYRHVHHSIITDLIARLLHSWHLRGTSLPFLPNLGYWLPYWSLSRTWRGVHQQFTCNIKMQYRRSSPSLGRWNEPVARSSRLCIYYMYWLIPAPLRSFRIINTNKLKDYHLSLWLSKYTLSIELYLHAEDLCTMERERVLWSLWQISNLM